jgi:hypothetical protein
VLDADTYRTDLELRLISLSLKDRLIDLTACVPTLVTSDACHPLTQSAFGRLCYKSRKSNGSENFAKIVF